MSSRALRKIRPGDVFELQVDHSSVELQAIRKHKTHGWAVRVVLPRAGCSVRNVNRMKEEQELYVVLIGDLAYEEAEQRSTLANVDLEFPGQYNFGGELNPSVLRKIYNLGLTLGIEVFPTAT